MQAAKENKRGFYGLLVTLALPIVLQNLIDSCVGAADTVMLNYVSQEALAAASLANNVQFVVNMFLMGLCSGSSVLIAQYWGKKDMTTIERTIGLSMRFSLLVGALFAALAIGWPEQMMRIFSKEDEIVELGATYLRIVGIGYLLNAFAQVYISAERAMERVMFGTLVNVAALLTNVVLNACFIFGLAFFPKMGIAGVAIATAISRLTAFLICVLDAMRDHPAKVRVKYFFERNRTLFHDYMQYALPALGNDFAWGLGFSTYSVILGRLGSNCVAANSYANTLRSLSTVVCFAIANAAAIIMGKAMGENRLKDAEVYAKRLGALSMITGALAGVIVAAITPFLMNFAQITPEAKEYLRWMLLISVPNVFGQSVNTMYICGIYRAGGDVRFGFIVDLVAMWVYGVAMGSLCAFVLKLPVVAVYAVMFLDEIVKMPVVLAHYRKKTWLCNITRDLAASEG